MNVVKKVYPNVEHGYCMQHLVRNMKIHFKHASKAVHWKFVKAAKAYNVQEWKSVTFLDNEDPDIHTNLENEVGHEKQARCHFNSK